MPKNEHATGTLHEQAVSILQKQLEQNIGGELNASADCNQCQEKLAVNLVAKAARVERNKMAGPVRPDLTLLNPDGDPIRFIEIVDSHAPEGNVHEHALKENIEVVEFHLRARGEFTGKRRNKALDDSLKAKARLGSLAEGRLEIDAHNILCQRPKSHECGSGLPLRTITISTTDCWNCGQNVNVAVGDKDGTALEQDFFTAQEREFARQNGVTLERRFSATARAKYLANMCTTCDQIQGNWFLYDDPFHDRFNLFQVKLETHGPCDKCSTGYCLTHGEYKDYDKTIQCPTCLMEAERVMCPHQPDRECLYPHECEEDGCYFVNRANEQRQWQTLHREQPPIQQEPHRGQRWLSRSEGRQRN